MAFFYVRTFLLYLFTWPFVTFITVKNAALAQPVSNISSLKFIDMYVIPNALGFKNTTVGGLSGIDFDAANNRYFMISDDRGAIGAARYYTAAIFITPKGIDSVHFTGVMNMLQPNGQLYPNKKQDPYHTPDPEAIRYNPVRRQLAWSSEGERIINKKDSILAGPAVTTISPQGKFINSYSLPDNLIMHSTEKGPRQNGVLEGMSFADNYTTLYVNAEAPLYEDGPVAEDTANNAYIRIFKFDVAGRQNTSQFGYKLEQVAHAPFPAGAFKINGVSDILAIGKNKLLVIERSFSTGRLACTVKLFIADLTGATDIKNKGSIKNNTAFSPVIKKLLCNMDDLGIYIDNVEGVTFGPVLPNGHKTLVFIADNNFSALQQSQLLLFEVME